MLIRIVQQSQPHAAGVLSQGQTHSQPKRFLVRMRNASEEEETSQRKRGWGGSWFCKGHCNGRRFEALRKELANRAKRTWEKSSMEMKFVFWRVGLVVGEGDYLKNSFQELRFKSPFCLSGKSLFLFHSFFLLFFLKNTLPNGGIMLHVFIIIVNWTSEITVT